MNRRAMLMTLAGLPLAAAGCGRIRQSRLNPFNWFGRRRRNETTATTTPGEAADGRVLVAEVTDLTIEEVPGGALIRATGLPPTQGWWKADLKSENHGRPDENGVLTYRFLVYPPPLPTPVSAPRSRDITVAVYISDIRLEGVAEIVVQGQSNSLSSRR